MPQEREFEPPPDEDASGLAPQVTSRPPVVLDELFATPQRPRFRITAGAAVVLALVAAAVVVLAVALQPRSSGMQAATTGTPTATVIDAAPSVAPRVLVHVLGAVVAPGVYELGPGGRVVDAIAAAGGFTDDAEISAINLARVAVDGEQLYVPRIGEEPRPAPGGIVGGGVTPGGVSGGLININTATVAELDTLPRIGPAIAQRIIDHREANGPFASVDDLGDVPGIGEATLEGLRDLVTV